MGDISTTYWSSHRTRRCWRAYDRRDGFKYDKKAAKQRAAVEREQWKNKMLSFNDDEWHARIPRNLADNDLPRGEYVEKYFSDPAAHLLPSAISLWQACSYPTRTVYIITTVNNTLVLEVLRSPLPAEDAIVLSRDVTGRVGHYSPLRPRGSHLRVLADRQGHSGPRKGGPGKLYTPEQARPKRAQSQRRGDRDQVPALLATACLTSARRPYSSSSLAIRLSFPIYRLVRSGVRHCDTLAADQLRRHSDRQGVRVASARISS